MRGWAPPDSAPVCGGLHPGRRGRYRADRGRAASRIAVDPYSEDSARCVPHVDFEPAPDDMVECLTPEGFAEIIAQVRAHCDRLDEVLARLVAARVGFGGE
ncbi:DUF6907 domain-containing protein [Streptomyces syringium]|uniref:DUF6907 domain-containing protein n=1 Tax=Streptomyces syringium TaxID=76729 RepID=UPI003F5160F5